MKKIGDVTSTADKNGEWTNGNVAAGIAPTILEAGWLNSVQREILGVIIAAGLPQDKNDDTQLSKAIKKIISGGNYATEEDLKKYLAKDQNGA
ncbi:phage tail protein, partial [Morganella morganii]